MVPFPVYPWLHAQVKLPGMLVQLALELQVVALAHSLISIGETIAIIHTKTAKFHELIIDCLP